MNNLTQSEAAKLTLRYLVSLYGKKKGSRMFAENQNNLFDYHGLAWSLGKECFPYFCNVFLHDLLFDYSGDKVPLSQKHYEIWGELQNLILNHNNTRNCYIFPREFGKTNTITVPVALWCALYCFHPFIVVQSSTEAQSQVFVNTMKIQLEDNSFIDSCFGQPVEPGSNKRSVINKNLKFNASEIELDIKPMRSKIQAVASTSSIRGINYGSYRIGLLLVDDGQDEKQITSDEACEAIVKRFNNGIMKALQNSNNHVISVGTIQRRGDLYDSMLTSVAWTVKTAKCILLDDIDDYFTNNEHWQKVKKILSNRNDNPDAAFDAENYYYDHLEEMQYPIIWNNYDCFRLAVEYFSDPVSFHQERQCNINSGMRRITSLSAIPAKDIESIGYTKTILSVDPAATVSAKSDYSAFCVMSESDNNIKYCRKCIIDKLPFEKYIEQIVNLLVAYPDIDTISIEKQTYSGADRIKLEEVISRHPLLKNRPFRMINEMRRKNKNARINTIIPDINMGRIVFNADDIEAIDQIKSFKGAGMPGTHDDMIDAVTDAAESLIKSYKPIPTMRVLNTGIWGL